MKVTGPTMKVIPQFIWKNGIKVANPIIKRLNEIWKEVNGDGKRRVKKIGQKEENIDKSKIIVIKNLPKGFEEDSIREFFGQFAQVVNVRVLRSPKTGKPKAVAYVEFSESDIAQVICEELDFYSLGTKILRCLPYSLEKARKLFDLERDRKLMSMGQRDLKTERAAKFLIESKMKEQEMKYVKPSGITKEKSGMKRKLNKSGEKLKKIGITYKFEK